MSLLAFTILGMLVEGCSRYLNDPGYVSSGASLSVIWAQIEDSHGKATFEEMMFALASLVDAGLIEQRGKFYCFVLTRKSAAEGEKQG